MWYSLPKQQTITENISFTDNYFKASYIAKERNMYAGQLKKKIKNTPRTYFNVENEISLSATVCTFGLVLNIFSQVSV